MEYAQAQKGRLPSAIRPPKVGQGIVSLRTLQFNVHMFQMLTVNNKSQSSSEIYTNTKYSGRDESQRTLTETKINTVQLLYSYISKIMFSVSIFSKKSSMIQYYLEFYVVRKFLFLRRRKSYKASRLKVEQSNLNHNPVNHRFGCVSWTLTINQPLHYIGSFRIWFFHNSMDIPTLKNPFNTPFTDLRIKIDLKFEC